MLDQSVSSYFRITTNGTMRTYRSNLLGSRNKLNSAMIKVQTKRQFTSYAENPLGASKAWQLRRSIWRTQDQIGNVQMLKNFNQTAWIALDAICDGTDDQPGLNGFPDIEEALNDPNAGGRKALGKSILSQVEALVSNMNTKYGDNYVFAGTDGLNAPFTWQGDKLCFRGIDVNSKQMEVKTLEDFPKNDGSGEYDQDAYKAYLEEYANSDYGKLEKYSKEKIYVDIGMGMQEDENGEFITSTGYDSSLCGINYLGFGLDEDGDSNNIVMLMKEAGEILSRCDADSGAFENTDPTNGDRKRLEVLFDKIHAKIGDVSEKHVELTADTAFLEKTELQLKERNDLLDEQREGIEGIDPADAISEMLWANYCYQASLKIGNQVLSQSLLDYMN